MRSRGIGLLVAALALTACSGGSDEADAGAPAGSEPTATEPSCRPEASVTVRSAPARQVPVAGELISLAPGTSAELGAPLPVSRAEVVLGLGEASEVVATDDLRRVVLREAAEQGLVAQALPATVTTDDLGRLANRAGPQRRWAVYAVVDVIDGSWVADGCPEQPLLGTVRGWSGEVSTGVARCRDGALVAGDEVGREVTAEICRG